MKMEHTSIWSDNCRHFLTDVNRNHFGILLVCVCMLFAACGQNSNGDHDESTDAQEVGEITDALPQETLQLIAETGDYVDYIFNDYPISFSQSEPSAVRQVAGFIDPEPTSMPEGCEPTAIVAFISQGEVLAEANLYFTDDCSHFVFFDENRNPTYSHPLRQQGKQYYESVLEQYFDALQQQQQ